MNTIHPTWTRIGGVLVSVMLATTGLFPATALAAASVDKSETVHVETDAQGGVTAVRVEELLANDAGTQELSDRSALEGIAPADEAQSYRGSADGTLTWSTAGKDVSYEGTTEQEPPVRIKVTYTLDGRPADPAELAGASGHLVIRFDYENTVSETRTIAGKEQLVYTPFLCMTAALLDGDVFSHVEATNGRVLEEKGSLAVIGYATPGLRESLDLDGQDLDLDLDLPEYLQIEADVTDLALDPVYTIVTPELFGDLDVDDLDLGDFGEGTGELRDAMGALIEGSGTLTSALRQLAKGSGQLGGGAAALRKALGALPDGMGKLQTGADTLADRLGEASGVATQLAGGASDLSDAANAAQGLASGASGAVGEAASAVQSLQEKVDGLKLDDTKKAVGAAAQAATDAKDAAAGAKELLDGHDAAVDGQRATVSGDLDAVAASLGSLEALLGDETLGLSEEQVATLSAQLVAAQESLAGARTDLEAIDAAAPAGLDEKVAALEDAAGRLGEQEGKVSDAAGDVSAVTDGAGAALGKLGEASGALAGVNQYLAGVAQGAAGVRDGCAGVAGGLAAAGTGARSLADGLGAVADQAPKALEGLDALATGASQLTTGIEATADGSAQLTDGLSTFDSEGIDKIADALDDLDGDVSGIKERVEALRDAAKAYDNFAGKADGTSGSVRFIYKTAQIG